MNKTKNASLLIIVTGVFILGPPAFQVLADCDLNSSDDATTSRPQIDLGVAALNLTATYGLVRLACDAPDCAGGVRPDTKGIPTGLS